MAGIKVCTSCGIPKPSDHFRKAKKGIFGVAGRCKMCQAAVDAEYRKTPARAESVLRYVHGPKHKERGNQWKTKNIEKRRAHEAVNNAIRDGRMLRQPCSVCGGKAEAHHEDYTKPLDVVWLCVTHHKALHREGLQCKDQKP